MKINSFKSVIAIVSILSLFGFNKEQRSRMPLYDSRGNSNGSPSITIDQIDGMFSIYHLNYDYGSIMAVDTTVSAANRVSKKEYWRYISRIFQNTGDTTHQINAGQLSLNDSLLQFSNSMYLSGFNSIDISNSDNVWNLAGTTNYSAFTYTLSRGIANYKPIIGYADTIKVSTGLSIDLSGLYNADTISVSVSDFNQTNPISIQKKAAGTVSQITFSAEELGTLTTNGGKINIMATNITKAILNNKNYLFCTATVYIKLINLKP